MARHASFTTVLRAALRVDSRLTGRTSPNALVYKGAVLFSKTIAHALSLEKMCPVPGKEAQLWDVSSTAVIVRAIAETYLAFRYYAIEPDSESDADFRLRLAEYHRWHKQYKLGQRFNIAGERLADVDRKRLEAKATLLADARFQSQCPSDQRKQLDGERSMHRRTEEIAQAASINRNIWGTHYMLLSQFAHSSPMAVEHLSNFHAGEAVAPSNLSVMLELAAAFLAKYILNLERLSPDCGAELSTEERDAITLEAGVLEGMRPGPQGDAE